MENNDFKLQEGQVVEVDYDKDMVLEDESITNDDELVQDTFSEDSMDDLKGDTVVENENAEEVTEGIGADFSARMSKPSAGNKFYNTISNGGYSQCVVGKPTDVCNVLANCVGYACGRFNEIIGEMKYAKLNCNAENFIERAIRLGLSVSNVPVLGGIMVWQKGSTLGSSDGAGHVAIVERIDNANQIYTSESGYGSSAFWNSTRTNNNGRWGMNSAYSFRGCIINPAIGDVHYEEPAPVPTPQPEPTPAPTPQPEPTPTPTVDILTLVKKTIRGDFGNGQSRRDALGDNFSTVMHQVNLNYQHGTTRWDNIKLY